MSGAGREALIANMDVEAPVSQQVSHAVPMSWCDVRFSVSGKEILKGISGEMRPGELGCILGPSGAGKTTLLNTLAGRQRTSGQGREFSGIIQLGDQVFTPKEMRKRVAFVMQDDALMATQTVRETLDFSAALRLPETSDEERAANVQQLLADLGLESCADTMIGSALIKGISGGERKRTSVGVELITRPSLVLLDEPTSGLDSYAACELVKQLRQLSRTGRLVCCTIHQPSSEVFELFEQVTCLRQGKALYWGSSAGLLLNMENAGLPCPRGYNVADWLVNVAQTGSDEQVGSIEQFCEKQAESSLTALRSRAGAVAGASQAGTAVQSDGEPTLEVLHAGFFKQLAYLTRREGQQFLRDKKAFGARMGMTLGQSILYALIFPGVVKSQSDLSGMSFKDGGVQAALGNEFGALVGLSIGAFFGASQPLILSFPLERPVFLREYSSNMYSVIAYFMSKTIVEMITSLVQNIVYFGILYWVLGFRASYFELVVATWLLALAAGSLALFVGCAVTSANSAIQLAPLITVPQILFSGLFLKSSQLPVYLRWVQYVCALKYAINLLCIGEFDGLSLPLVPDLGRDFLQSQDIDPGMWWVYMLILLGIFLGFRVLALISLKRKSKYVF